MCNDDDNDSGVGRNSSSDRNDSFNYDVADASI